MFTDIPVDSAETWRVRIAGEIGHRSSGTSSMVMYRQELPTSKKHGWDAKRPESLGHLAHPHRPAARLDSSQGTSSTTGSGRWPAHQSVSTRTATRSAGCQPAQRPSWPRDRVAGQRGLPADRVRHGAADTRQDLQLIHRMNKSKDQPWRPKSATDDGAGYASSWDEWVQISLGGAFLSDLLFDRLYLTALDGFMHSYQDSTRLMLDFPVSMDSKKTRSCCSATRTSCWSPSTRTPICCSRTRCCSRRRRRHSRRCSAAGGCPVGCSPRHAPSAEITKRRNYIRKWRAETGQPIPLPVSAKNFSENGKEMIRQGSSTNVLYRILLNLRIGTALINPALYVSMGPEQWVRGITRPARQQPDPAGHRRLHRETRSLGHDQDQQRLARSGAGTRRAATPTSNSGWSRATSPEERSKIEAELMRYPREDVLDHARPRPPLHPGRAEVR